MANRMHGKSIWKRALTACGGIMIAILLILLLYVSQYYHADSDALEALKSTDRVVVEKCKKYLYFDGPGEDNAYIFYPGAKVATESYAPLMRNIAENGMDVYLVNMPFHLAFFGMNRAENIISENTQYENWYIGGHSLGGAMAAYYASAHLEELTGVILLAAYPTKSLQADGMKVMSFWGSEDGVLNMKRVQDGRAYMPEDNQEIEISGGNHAQFGNYGVQTGDNPASISAKEQQDIVVQNVITLLKKNRG